MASSPITRRCPNCNAQPGEPCTQPSDTGRTNVKWYHFARETEPSERLPSWLEAKIDQRIALIVEKLDLDIVPSGTLIMTPVTEPKEGSSEAEMKRWDHSCDNCGTYLESTLVTGQAQRTVKGLRMIFTFGSCVPCLEQP